MKKGSVVALVVIAIAAAIVVTSFGDASVYVTFATAQKMVSEGNDQKVHVVGELKKDPFGNVLDLVYDDNAKPIKLSFPLIDDEGREELVVLYDFPKPAELNQSEKIVVIGKYEGDVFIGDEILLKCPSKYENEEF